MKKRKYASLASVEATEALTNQEIEKIRETCEGINELFNNQSSTVVFSALASIFTQAVCTLCDSKEEAEDVVTNMAAHIVSSIALAEAAGVCNWRDKDSPLQ